MAIGGRKWSRHSLNIRAAFLHNLSDALASLGVMIAGALILLYGWYWVDALLTILIAGYVLWQGFSALPEVIHLLMEGAPSHLSLDEVAQAIAAVEGVENVHHLHVWRLDEHRNALEAHVTLPGDMTLSQTEPLKAALKTMLAGRFGIAHTTLEMEYSGSQECKNSPECES